MFKLEPSARSRDQKGIKKGKLGHHTPIWTVITMKDSYQKSLLSTITGKGFVVVLFVVPKRKDWVKGRKERSAGTRISES